MLPARWLRAAVGVLLVAVGAGDPQNLSGRRPEDLSDEKHGALFWSRPAPSFSPPPPFPTRGRKFREALYQFCASPIPSHPQASEAEFNGTSITWGVVRYAHVSNSGGTTVCTMARKVGLLGDRTTTASECPNCNGPTRGPGDWDQWLDLARQGEGVTCADLASLVAQRRFSFFASETFLEEMDAAQPRLCPQFKYFMIIKHPVVRMVNQLLRVEDNSTRTLETLRRTWRNESAPPAIPCFRGQHRVLCLFMASNANIRFLLGPDTFLTPWREIAEPHLERARGLLSQFALALPLDKLSEPSSRLMMSERLGWPLGALSAVHANRHDTPQQQAPSDSTGLDDGAVPAGQVQQARPGSQLPGLYGRLDDESMRLIWELNRLDIELYSWLSREWERKAAAKVR